MCCYILQSCSGSGQQDTSCDNAASGVANLASLGGTNNGNVPVGRSGCSNGNCLLALNSALYACSIIQDAAACTACEPVFGQSLRGAECAVSLGAFEGGCCYAQDADPTRPNAFQGCNTNDDCDGSLYSGISINVVSATCVQG